MYDSLARDVVQGVADGINGTIYHNISTLGNRCVLTQIARKVTFDGFFCSVLESQIMLLFSSWSTSILASYFVFYHSSHLYPIFFSSSRMASPIIKAL